MPTQITDTNGSQPHLLVIGLGGFLNLALGFRGLEEVGRAPEPEAGQSQIGDGGTRDGGQDGNEFTWSRAPVVLWHKHRQSTKQ